MIAESKRYSGVVCLRCGKPIAVSAKVTHLKDQVEHGEMHVAHAFAARCKRCHSECVYVISDIRTFDEEPHKRTAESTGGRKIAHAF